MGLLPSEQLPDLETCDSEDAFARKEMLKSFGFMLEPGAGPDLTTICNELTWKYYTFIMYPRSDYFTEANRSGLAESNTRQIDLSAEEPRLDLRMIRFLYTLVYEISVHSPLNNLKSTPASPVSKNFSPSSLCIP